MVDYLEMLKKLRAEGTVKSDEKVKGEVADGDATIDYRAHAHARTDKFRWSNRITADAQGRPVNRTQSEQPFDHLAGVAEFDGGLPRAHAEVLAALQTIQPPLGFHRNR